MKIYDPRKRSPWPLRLAATAVISAVLSEAVWLAAKPAGVPTLASVPAQVAVFFSPHGNCEAAVCNAIRAATKTITLQAYGLTSLPIAAELRLAVKRGVVVEVCQDLRASKGAGELVDSLSAGGCVVKLNGNYAIAHSKCIVIDGHLLLTGSYNWTASAENRNLENLLLIESPELCAKYSANFESNWQRSTPYNQIPAQRPSEAK